MSRRFKHLSLVLITQTVCVAVGLWIHHHYALASARHAAEEQAWAHIQAWTHQLAPELRAELDSTGEWDAATTARLRTLSRSSAAPDHGRWFLADSGWNVVLAGHGNHRGDPDHETWCTPGQHVDWVPAPDQAESAPGPRRGRLNTSQGAQLALAYPRGDGQGFLVAYRPVAAIDAEMAALAPSLMGASAIALLWSCALLGILIYLVTARFYDATARERERAEAQSMERMESLVRMRDAIIFGLAKLAESRDTETGDHLERMSIYATRLATSLQHHPRYRNEVTPAFVRLIGISSSLHDIGKVGIEDAILLKPCGLTAEERVKMQKHTEIGGECLLQIEQRLGSSNFLQMAREIAFAHHERWDGTGYPSGRAGEEIPLSARIVAIADVYDALSSKRPYKAPFPHYQCAEIIRNGAGKAFDPQLVEVWLTIQSWFRDIARQYWPNTIDQAKDDSGRPSPSDPVHEGEPALVGASDE